MEIKKINWRSEITDLLILTVGCVFYGVGIACFLDPNNVTPGGLAGIAMIICRFIDIDTGLMIFILNVPLFVSALIRFKGKFAVYTLYALALSSWVIDWTTQNVPSLIPVTGDLILAATTGGVVMAFGAALVYRAGGSTGGLDIVIKFLRQKYPHLKTGVLTTMTDFLVTVMTCIAFNDLEIGLYGVITLVVNGYVIDTVLYGTNEAKMIFVVSDEPEKIARRLMDELEIGVTYLNGNGAYTGAEKKVVLTVFRKGIYYNVREIVKQEDPYAFLIVSSANEIFGEGFKDHFADEV